MLRYYKTQHVICLTDGVLEQYDKAKKKARRRIAPEKLEWKPPVFSREQLRFGY
jgi:histone acetyltransferase HTATIP